MAGVCEGTARPLEKWLYLEGEPFPEEMDAGRQVYIRRAYPCL